MAKKYWDPKGYDFTRYPATQLSEEEWQKFLCLPLTEADRALLLAIKANHYEPTTLEQAKTFFAKGYEFLKEVQMSDTVGLRAKIRESGDLKGFILSTNGRVYWIARRPR